MIVTAKIIWRLLLMAQCLSDRTWFGEKCTMIRQISRHLPSREWVILWMTNGRVATDGPMMPNGQSYNPFSAATTDTTDI